MRATASLLQFRVEEGSYALDVARVERVLRAAEVTRLPDGPDIVCGLINIAGEIVPVIDMRRRLGLAARETEPSDRFILIRSSDKLVALRVDGVEGVVALTTQSISGGDVSPPLAVAAADEEGSLVLIQDPEAILSEVDQWRIDDAWSRIPNG
jgi:purine-binding chemotaxis protein CheW